MPDQFIERRMVTGLIVSTDYTAQIRKVWNSRLLGSRTARRLAGWCLDFYDQYNQAPGKEIEAIFMRHAKRMKKDEVADIEDILEGLSEEYERQDKFNVRYLLDQTMQYFDERGITDLIEDVKDQLAAGEVQEARQLIYNYRPAVGVDSANTVDLASPEVLDELKAAFAEVERPLVRYPRQLGEFLNSSLVRGGFVCFSGIEKRGKTFLLLDLAMRARRQGVNVAFFQCGDMTKHEQMVRAAIYLTKKSNQDKYVGRMWEPVRDCVKNQLDDCDRDERECDLGVFADRDEEFLRRDVTHDDLVEAYRGNPDYRPCHNCSHYWKNRWGAVWLKEVDVGRSPLQYKEAERAYRNFFIKHKRSFKLSTHPSGTLSMAESDRLLDVWEREDGFVPDLIIYDYVALMASDLKNESFRNQENDKWQRARGISQKRHALVVTVDQSDALAYDKDLLMLKNFSEDKRKYSHVTAWFGLNQDAKGREKKLGVMRINELLARNDAFSNTNQVHVLQNLKRGQPCLSSYSSYW